MSTVLPRSLLAGLLFAFAAVTGWTGEPLAHVVLRPVINFHSAPREDSDVVTQATLGARLLELDRKDGWVRVKGDDDYPGWTPLTALRPLATTERYPASLEPGKAVEVDALAANIYQEPDVTKHAPVLTAPFGVRLERLNGGRDTQRWIEVRLPDRRVAWIQSGDVRTDLRPLSSSASTAAGTRSAGSRCDCRTAAWPGSRAAMCARTSGP